MDKKKYITEDDLKAVSSQEDMAELLDNLDHEVIKQRLEVLDSSSDISDEEAIKEFLALDTQGKEAILDMLTEGQEELFLIDLEKYKVNQEIKRRALDARRSRRRSALSLAWDREDFSDVDGKINIRKLTAVVLAVMESKGVPVTAKAVTEQVLGHVATWEREAPVQVGRGKVATSAYLKARCSSILSDSSDGLLKVLPAERLGKSYVQALSAKYGG